MNAEQQLLEHCGDIVDSPEAVSKLRKFIFDLAVRGKLAEHDPNDELADELIHLIDQGTHKTPRNWIHSTVGNLLIFKYGKGKKIRELSKEGAIPVYGSNGVVGYCETPLSNESVIVVGRKGSAGSVNLCSGPSWTTDVAFYVEIPDYFFIRYLCIALGTLNLTMLAKGVKPGLNRYDAYELPLDVPPKSEQHRIAAKVDELMDRCDRLEEKFREREHHRKRFTKASFASLTESGIDEGEFRKRSGFVVRNFDRLSIDVDQIKGLRQLILDLAVRGRLVEQDPNDEPADELLHPIDQGTPKTPRSWVHSTVGNLLIFKYGKGKKIRELSKEGAVPVYGSNGVVGYCETPLSNESVIVIGRKGSAGSVNQCNGPSWTTDVAFHVEIPDYFFIQYLYIALRTLNLSTLAKGIKPGLNRYDAYELPLAVPPKSEQHRIVAKVDDLMALCDALESSTLVKRKQNSELLKAILHKSL